MSSDPTPGDLDSAVLARFRAGEVSALSEVFEMYGARVYRLARQILGNEEDAEDATQEIFLRAFERAAGFEGRSGLFTWLYRLAVRHCLNMITQRKRAETPRLVIAARSRFDVEAPAPSPLSLLSSGEQHQILNGHLRALPGSYRACLILRELEGFSYRQIAELLEIPIGTVMSRLTRARAVLRANLEVNEDDRCFSRNKARHRTVKERER